MNKMPLLLTGVCYLVYWLIRYLTGEVWLPLLVFAVPLGLLILNLLLRRTLSFKKWFLSPANILLERRMHNSFSDIEAGLLYDKLLDVIKNSQFTLLDADKTTGELLCGTSINLLTWGENIYVRLEAVRGGSQIHITSVTLFGNTSWNRNETNMESFIDSLETSLTI